MMRLCILLFGVLLTSCNKGPQPIAYGEEYCHYCRMTIVDNQHAAQLVTEKGKIYNFDAIECMIHFYTQEPATQMSHIVVNDFMKPGTFIEVQNASFVISPELPSPMGANLSAFSSHEQALQVLEDKSGNSYNWEQLLVQIR